jgi:hypothetical protein
MSNTSIPMMPVLWPIDGIQIADLPNHVAVVPVVLNGQKRVALQVATPAGVNFAFMSYELAELIADKLKEITHSIAIVPAGTLPRPPG